MLGATLGQDDVCSRCVRWRRNDASSTMQMPRAPWRHDTSTKYVLKVAPLAGTPESTHEWLSVIT
jgi:hypothetical protein